MKTNKFFFEYAFVCLWIIFVIYDLLLEYSSFIAAIVFFFTSVWIFSKKYYEGLYDFGIQKRSDGVKLGMQAIEIKYSLINEKKNAESTTT